MNETAAIDVWDLLVGLHRWMSVDFVDTVNHAPAIGEEETRTIANFLPRYERLRLELSPQARAEIDEAWNSVVAGANTMFAQLSLQVEYNKGNNPTFDPKAWRETTSVLWTGVVKDFERSLDVIRPILMEEFRGRPTGLLPSLTSVGGSVTIVGDVSDSEGIAIGPAASARTESVRLSEDVGWKRRFRRK